MVKVVTGWRIYKSWRIAQSFGYSQAAVRPIGMYLAKSTAIGTGIGVAASAVIVEWIDQKAVKGENKRPTVGLQNFGGKPLPTPTYRKMGLRTTDEVADVINMAIDSAQQWKSFGQAKKEAPGLVADVIERGGITTLLGVTGPTVVYKVLKEQVPQPKPSIRVGLHNFGGPYKEIRRPSAGGFIVGVSKALAIL